MKRFALLFACVLSASAVVRADVKIPVLDGSSKDASYDATSPINIPNGSLPGLTNVSLGEALGSIIAVDGNEHAHETLTGTDAVSDLDKNDIDDLQGTITVDFGTAFPNTTGGTTADTTLTSMDFTGTFDGVSIEIKNVPNQTSPTGQTTITTNPGGMFNIHSFFDVFTEISLDHGSFTPITNGSGPGGSTEFDLTSAPLPAALPAGLGLLAVVGIARRFGVGKVGSQRV